MNFAYLGQRIEVVQIHNSHSLPVERNQLSALLKLLDDRSPNVRAKVRRALREFGPDLPREIGAAGLRPSATQQALLDDIVRASLTRTHTAFGALWGQWRRGRDEYVLLETTLDHLSRVQYEWEGDGRADESPSLGFTLDEIATSFRHSGQDREAEVLATWLFDGERFRGAAPENYYLPYNGNMLHVVESGEGLPLSLVLIFMLVGRRLDMVIEGAAFPGHFLARAGHDYFDCYDGGRKLSPSEELAITRAAPDSTEAASAASIIARVLANLANAYQFLGERDKVHRTLLFLEQLREQEPEL